VSDHLEKPTILIVDDIPTNVMVLSRALQNDYRIKIADNGKAALFIAQSLPHPDLILLDVMMPEMDGFEVCRHLKENEASHDIPIIFITAKDGENDEAYGLSLGAVDYITKPFSIAIARARIRNHIRLVQQERRLKREILEHKAAKENLQVAGLVYDATSEAMLLTDSDNCIMAVNPAFTAVTGYSQDDVIGKTPKLLSSGQHDEQFYQSMWNSLETTGAWQGEIWNRRKNGELYAEWLTINTIYNKDGSVRRRVALFSDITLKKQADDLIWQQANYDALTNLPNRRLFHDRLAQEIKKAKRNREPLALFFLDLDRFKEINDTLGHDAGDMLLVEASRRLSHCVRESDTVARLGGDEFTVIMVDAVDIAGIERIAQAIVQRLAEPFGLGKETVYVSASVGITLFPNDADSVDTLLKNADQAMYAAKDQGRNRYCYFTAAMQEAAQSRMHLITDLRQALAEDQFRIHFQPIVDMATGHIEKAEALLRWEHPRRGLILPNEFIPLAEETGLITAIGDWVFKETTRLLKRWLEKTGRSFQVSINLSATQLTAGKETATWLEHLAELELPGELIVIEITESLLLQATPMVIQQLQEFRRFGIKVAIDDFGTGYSALSYLKNFHIDYLKIDQSFVNELTTNANDLALSEAIIVLAHKLGYQVIAEGVETLDQKHLLSEAGCDKAQGYLFSRPISAEAFEALLQETPQNPL
jgi:diguanylate cyclase (GGDEF)-like protein/PAS domain S-box-containing protein